MKSWIAAASAAVVLTVPAMADQCAVLDTAQSIKLSNLVDKGFFDSIPGLLTYCAPCGDKEAKGVRIRKNTKMVIKEESKDPYAYSFSYDGHALDAAYTYVPAESSKEGPFRGARSLAGMIDCPVTPDTPAAIDVDAKGLVTPTP